MPTLTRDEQLAKMSGQLEQLIQTTVKQNDNISRAEAIRMIARFAMAKATQGPRRKLIEPVPIATV